MTQTTYLPPCEKSSTQQPELPLEKFMWVLLPKISKAFSARVKRRKRKVKKKKKKAYILFYMSATPSLEPSPQR